MIQGIDTKEPMTEETVCNREVVMFTKRQSTNCSKRVSVMTQLMASRVLTDRQTCYKESHEGTESRNKR